MGFLTGTTSYGVKGGDDALAAKTREFAKLQLIARQKSLLPEDKEAPDPTGFKGFFMRTVDLISRPNYAVAGFWDTLAGNGRAGENAFERVYREMFSGLGGLKGDKETFADVLEQAGMPEYGSLSDLVGDNGLTRNFNPTTRGAVGLALDIFLDPLTYVTAPVKNASAIVGQGGEIRYLNKQGRKLLAERWTQKLDTLRADFDLAADASEHVVLDAVRTRSSFIQSLAQESRTLAQVDGIVGRSEVRRVLWNELGEELLDEGRKELFEGVGLRFRLPGVDVPIGLDRALEGAARRTGSLFRESLTNTKTGRMLFDFGDKVFDDLQRLFTRHPQLAKFNKAYMRMEAVRFQRFQAAQHVAGLEMDKLFAGVTKKQLEKAEVWEQFIRAVEEGAEEGPQLQRFLDMATAEGIADPAQYVTAWRDMFNKAGALEVTQKLISEEGFAAGFNRYFSRLTGNMPKKVREKLKEYSSGQFHDLRAFSEASGFESWDEFKRFAIEHGAKESDFIVNPREVGVQRLSAHYQALINQQFLDEVGSRFGMSHNKHLRRMAQILAKEGDSITTVEQKVIEELQSRDPMFTGKWDDAANVERRRVLHEAKLHPDAEFRKRLDSVLDGITTEENAERVEKVRERLWGNHKEYRAARREADLADSGFAKGVLTRASERLDTLMQKFDGRELSPGDIVALRDELVALRDDYADFGQALVGAGAFKLQTNLPTKRIQKALSILDDMIASEPALSRTATIGQRESLLSRRAVLAKQHDAVDDALSATTKADVELQTELFARRDLLRKQLDEIDGDLDRIGRRGPGYVSDEELILQREKVARQVKGRKTAWRNMKPGSQARAVLEKQLQSTEAALKQIDKELAARAAQRTVERAPKTRSASVLAELTEVARGHKEALAWRDRAVRKNRVMRGRFEQDLDLLDQLNNEVGFNQILAGKKDPARLSEAEAMLRQAEIDRELFLKLSPQAKRAFLGAAFEQIEHIKDVERFLSRFSDDLSALGDDLGTVIDDMYEGNVLTLRDMYGQEYVTKRFGQKYYTIPEGIAQSLKVFDDRFIINEEIGRLLTVFDQLNNWFKVGVTRYFPSFHVRNAYSNVAAVFMDIGIEALDPRRAKQAIDILLGRDGTLKLPDGSSLPYAAIRGELDALGVRVDKLLLFELTGKFKGDPIEGLGAKLLRHDDVRGKAWGIIEKAYSVPNNVENHARAMHYLALRRRGFSPEDASFQVNKFLFDYGDLSAAEKGVFRRLFPFWVWTKKNAARQIANLYEAPGRVATTIKIATGDRGPEGDLLPEYLRGQMQVKLQEDGKGETWLTGIDLPISSMEVLWAGSIGKTFREQIGMLTPLIKTPLEIGIGTEFFTGQGTRGVGRINTRLGNALNRNLPQELKDYFQLENRGTDDAPQWDANRLKVHLVFKGVFLSRFVSYGLQMDDALKQIGNGDEIAGAKAAFKLLAGLDLRTYDLSEKQRAILYNRTQRLQEFLVEKGVMGEYRKPFVHKENAPQETSRGGILSVRGSSGSGAAAGTSILGGGR